MIKDKGEKYFTEVDRQKAHGQSTSNRSMLTAKFYKPKAQTAAFDRSRHNTSSVEGSDCAQPNTCCRSPQHVISKSAMMSTGSTTPPSNDSAPPPCPLEEMNLDCITAVLPDINSLTDLGAFVRASRPSPADFGCFLSAKAE